MRVVRPVLAVASTVRLVRLVTDLAGYLNVVCPTCGRLVHIPVTCSSPLHVDGGRTVMAVDVDREVVRAHEATHTG